MESGNCTCCTHSKFPSFSLNRVVCPNFGYDSLTSLRSNDTFLQGKNCNNCKETDNSEIVLAFEWWYMYYFRSIPKALAKCVNIILRSYRRVCEVRAHYPISYSNLFLAGKTTISWESGRVSSGIPCLPLQNTGFLRISSKGTVRYTGVLTLIPDYTGISGTRLG